MHGYGQGCGDATGNRVDASKRNDDCGGLGFVAVRSGGRVVSTGRIAPSHPIQNGEPGIVNSVQITTSSKQHDPALQSALRAARENESRWLAMQADYATDSESVEQWASTAKLRRLEVERLEAVLA